MHEGSFMTLSDEIRKCTKCIDLGIASSDRLNSHQKPYVQFAVEGKWKPPDEVDVLFIAESPPWNGKQRYFYNPNVGDERPSLREKVLKYLKLNSLEEFKLDKRFFLIDTIKCRLNKSKNIKPRLSINGIAKTCAEQFLCREIEELKPQTIFVLGDIAKKALQRFSEFSELKEHKVSKGFDGNLSGYRVVLCVFPNRRTEAKYKTQIRGAFAKLL